MSESMREDRRAFESTDFEYVARCDDGCGEITPWLASLDAANDAKRVHEKDRGHRCIVTNRMRH